ncbi:MAG TPA: fatty acid desaturase [Stellaceae bacterium]|nr:fatty acid desaturase [Stellaceae bacterium]
MENWVSRSGLIDPVQLKELSRRSDAQGLLQLASHLGALGVTGTALAMLWGGWWGVPVFVAHGYLINCLFATQHECNHQTAFKSRWLNDAVRRCTGLTQLYPAWWEAWFHFAHHRHTGDWEKDAELMFRGRYTRASYLYSLSGIGYWHGRIRSLLRISAGRIPASVHWLTDSQRRYVVWEARGHLAFYVALAAISVWFESELAVTLWLAPLLITKPLHQLQNMGEHLGLEDGGLDTTRNTRTLRVPAPVRWALWQMPYHTAHHTFPGVPFHRLPELSQMLEARLGRPLPTASYREVVIGALRATARGPEGSWALPFAAGANRPAGSAELVPAE